MGVIRRSLDRLSDGDAWERWTPAWGVAMWIVVWMVLLGSTDWAWLAPWRTETKPSVTVQITENDPITVEGLVRTGDGKLVGGGGRVDVLVSDVVTGNTVFVGTGPVEADDGSFTITDELVPRPETVDQTVREERILEARARFVPTGGTDNGDVETDPSATAREGTETSAWVRLILAFAIVFLLTVLYLFVAAPTIKRVTALFAFSYFVVLFSFLLPFALTYAITQDDGLVAKMRKSPVGLAEAINGGRHDWYVRVGGHLTPASPEPQAEVTGTPGIVADTSPRPAGRRQPTPPASPVATTAGAIEEPAWTLEGGLGVPIWVVVLAAFGASLAMAREIPRLQSDCPVWLMPPARFPSVGSRVIGGITLGLFGADPSPPSKRAGECLGRARKRVIELYLNIVAAPFLAIAVYYLIQAVSGDTLQPAFVVIAFATGLFSDVFVTKIKKFIDSRGEEVDAGGVAAAAGSAEDVSEDDDELDGCEVDMTTDPVPDDELDLIVLGDSDESADEYAALLRTTRRRR